MNLHTAIITFLLGVMIVGCSTADGSQSKAEHKCLAGCDVTFYEIVPKRDTYSGKTIYISGYLALTNGYLALQPSKDMYLSSMGDASSILFRLPEGVQKNIIDSHLNSYVSVRGLFFAESGDRLIGIGYFSGPVDVYVKAVGDRPEEASEWKVRLEEMEQKK